MSHNVISQQNLLTKSFFKVYLICGLTTLFIGLAGFNTICQADFSPENLISTIFPRHLIFSGLIPTYLLGLLPAIQIRPQDILLYQSRKIVSLQVLYRVCFTMLPMAIIWGFANIFVLSVNDYLNFLGDLWLPILIRAVYLWITVFLLGLITVMLAIATKSKLIAFFISFGINSLSFTFVISKRPSLFFDFSTLDSNGALISKGIIMLGIALLMVPLMTFIVNRRDI
ncbi:hypothetical protein [Lacticaseibacillus paracasei]|uniref:hypothetical protein n=1 Tax=Lacticaseibacillus paracasei TaxID=1597 RepID=UPI0021A7FCFA|nr:hypothetical protein [Lacticaseibacillus paracasei]MCT2892331.1 hypothetical protein [Lacticaseibacillus paracasei]